MDHQYQNLYQNAWVQHRMKKIARMERKISRQMEKIDEDKIYECKIKKRKTDKKISFNTTISAILIPTAKEMDAETRSNLWWNKKDYKRFRFSSKIETDWFLSIHQDLEYKDATRLLYQHSIICYEPYMICY